MKNKKCNLNVWTLKSRLSGEEDDVQVFTTLSEAQRAVFISFEEGTKSFFTQNFINYITGNYSEILYVKWKKLLETERKRLTNDFQIFLHSNDIGYFNIQKHKIPLPEALNVYE